ncbi:MAG: GntR family transcriptional regulator [Tissierellia bacterium]|nr:GntR family transcriptional regulator [Tissierellia bacterium]
MTKRRLKHHKEEKGVTTLAVKRAYDYVKQNAIDFAVHPGMQINEVEIANTLKMSRVPVREALNRLVVGRFVFFKPGKGFYYRKFSETEMANLYEIRYDLEIAIIKNACRMEKREQMDEILQSWEEVSKVYKDMDNAELIMADEAFHLSIADLADNMERIHFLQNIYERTRFVRCISIESELRCDEFVKEHMNLILAIAARDEDEALKLMKYHLGVNSRELKDNIKIGMMRIYADEIS